MTNLSPSGHPLPKAYSDQYTSCCFEVFPVTYTTFNSCVGVLKKKKFCQLFFTSNSPYYAFIPLFSSLSSVLSPSLKCKASCVKGVNGTRQKCSIKSMWDTWWPLIVANLSLPNQVILWPSVTIFHRCSWEKQREKWKIIRLYRIHRSSTCW